MAELVKAVAVKISVSGVEEAKLQIGRLTVAAEDLSKVHPEISVQIDRAKALMEARLTRAGIQAELGKAINVPVKTDSGGFMSKLLPGLFGGIPIAGASAAPGAAAGGGQIAGLAAAGGPIAWIGGITAAIAAAIAGVGGIVPAIAAAGMGVASFGALAIPTFSKISAGVTAVDAATTKVARNAAWAAIPKSLQPIVHGVLGVQSTFDKLAASMQPLVLKIAGVGLDIANKLLPTIKPFAEAAGNAILGLLKQFDKFSTSPGFKTFMANMLQLAGPAITTIGKGIGEIAVSIGKLLQRMMTPQGLLILGYIFKGIAGAINLVGIAFHGMASLMFTEVPAIMMAFGRLLQGIKGVADSVLGVIGTIVDGMAKAFGWVPVIGSKLRTAAKYFDNFRASVDSNLNTATRNLNNWAISLINAPKVFKLQGNITDLQSKLATAEALLKNKDLTATRRAKIEANIDQLQAAIASAKAQLNALNGYTATTYIATQHIGGPQPLPHRAAGGYASGLYLAGEYGPELVQSPPGSYVHTAQQTAAMLRGGGGNTYNITVNALVADRNAGARVVEAIKQFEHGSGTAWRSGRDSATGALVTGIR